MAKLKDIAQKLNISVSTVSRVVNNLDRVDPETRKRVLEALKEYDYLPDDNARRLKTRTSNVLGVIVPDISNPFYASAIKGIERVAADGGYSVIVCNTEEDGERERNAVRLLQRQKVAGYVVATILDDERVLQCYSTLDSPVVFFDNAPDEGMQFNAVTINNFRAARELVGYMARRGHRRIFMIAGPAGESSADERMQGWRAALWDAGIEPGDGWCVNGDFREESGRRVMEAFLARGDRPTAVCVANNFMAYGAAKAVFDAGLDIPEDLSMGAFDIVDDTGLMRLKITTVIQPAGDIGAVAADMCLNPRGPENVQSARRVVLEHRFLENGTVKQI